MMANLAAPGDRLTSARILLFAAAGNVPVVASLGEVN